MLPFTHAEFVEVFRLYNQAIWPAQIVAYILGTSALGALLRPGTAADRFVLGVLAAMWAWTGILYHGVFFSSINAAGFAFAFGFVLEGALFMRLAIRGRLPAFGLAASATGWIGVVLVAYAMLIYPLVGVMTGQGYPAVPVFGVAPCPVVIFTFGVLLLSRDRVPAWLLVLPGLWSLIGGSAAFLLAVPQDWPLLASGAIAIPLIVRRDLRAGAAGAGA
jgi:Family of unknown function (DUF6064)